jgi:hypothetical protein
MPFVAVADFAVDMQVLLDAGYHREYTVRPGSQYQRALYLGCHLKIAFLNPTSPLVENANSHPKANSGFNTRFAKNISQR